MLRTATSQKFLGLQRSGQCQDFTSKMIVRYIPWEKGTICIPYCSIFWLKITPFRSHNNIARCGSSFCRRRYWNSRRWLIKCIISRFCALRMLSFLILKFLFCDLSPFVRGSYSWISCFWGNYSVGFPGKKANW